MQNLGYGPHQKRVELRSGRKDQQLAALCSFKLLEKNEDDPVMFWLISYITKLRVGKHYIFNVFLWFQRILVSFIFEWRFTALKLLEICNREGIGVGEKGLWVDCSSLLCCFFHS